MTVLKSSGKIYGAKFTAAERKAMEIEIRKEIAVQMKENAKDIDSMILWFLHFEFGFGKKKLRRAYDRMEPMMKQLIEHYEMDDSEKGYLCRYQLKNYGVDIDEWHKENEEGGE